MQPEPIEYDILFCKYEQMEIRDPLFLYDFITKHLVSGDD